MKRAVESFDVNDQHDWQSYWCYKYMKHFRTLPREFVLLSCKWMQTSPQLPKDAREYFELLTSLYGNEDSDYLLLFFAIYLQRRVTPFHQLRADDDRIVSLLELHWQYCLPDSWVYNVNLESWICVMPFKEEIICAMVTAACNSQIEQILECRIVDRMKHVVYVPWYHALLGCFKYIIPFSLLQYYINCKGHINFPPLRVPLSHDGCFLQGIKKSFTQIWIKFHASLSIISYDHYGFFHELVKVLNGNTDFSFETCPFISDNQMELLVSCLCCHDRRIRFLAETWLKNSIAEDLSKILLRLKKYTRSYYYFEALTILNALTKN